MEFTRKQQQTRDSRAADQSAYAAYAATKVAAADQDKARRNHRYCELRLSGLSIDDAYEALRAELALAQIVGLTAYEDEYQCDETLDQVIAWHAPQLAR